MGRYFMLTVSQPPGLNLSTGHEFLGSRGVIQSPKKQLDSDGDRAVVTAGAQEVSEMGRDTQVECSPGFSETSVLSLCSGHKDANWPQRQEGTASYYRRWGWSSWVTLLSWGCGQSCPLISLI